MNPGKGEKGGGCRRGKGRGKKGEWGMGVKEGKEGERGGKGGR